MDRHSNSSASEGWQPSWRIESEYVDARGQLQYTARSAIEAISRALSTDSSGNAVRRVEVLRIDGQRQVHLPDVSGAYSWKLLLDGRTIASGTAHGSTIDLPILKTGSYVLAIQHPEDRTPRELLIIVAPEIAYQPPVFRDGGRVWLLAVQLYSIRSHRNWGHGDFTDLSQLLRIAAKTGAAGIGVNPLHALAPGQASPYSPSSRLFLNPLYIDIEAIPEFQGFASPGMMEEVAMLRVADEIDYGAIHAIKFRALKTAYKVFRNQADIERRAAFDGFRKLMGASLSAFCAFEHLRERFGMPGREGTQEWQRVGDAFDGVDDEDVEFHAFIQWIADQQLRACRDLARELGLPVGLYLDVAVGVDAGGADAWSAPDGLSQLLSIGAPPDIYNPAGQNWGLAALHPQALIDSDFALYRQTLRSVMRYAGAIRIDHALGLNRLFLIPRQAAASGGGYVSYPFDAMLAVTAQESQASKCLVIGEDLGTIPEGVFETLNGWGVWSYRVAMFERYGGADAFKPPDHFPQKAIVTFNTHDLPTFAGWIATHDLMTKTELGLDPGETNSERHDAHHAMRNTLAQQNIPEELSLPSVLRYLARTQSQILAVAIEDIIGLKDQPNIPGTIDEHPNWRRRLPVTLEAFGDNEMLDRIATVFLQEGRGFPGDINHKPAHQQ